MDDHETGHGETHHGFRRDLKAVAVVPQRLGELLLIGGLVLIGAPFGGVHELAGYSPLFLGFVTGCVGAVLVIVSMVVRARYRSHHARMHGEG